MSWKLALVLFAALYTVEVRAQDRVTPPPSGAAVKVHVVDAATTAPIASALVEVLSLTTGREEAAHTDTFGWVGFAWEAYPQTELVCAHAWAHASICAIVTLPAPVETVVELALPPQ